jgi:hypothetical protein
MITVARASKRRKLQRKGGVAPAVAFRPRASGFSPPELCWDVVLANPQTARVLSSWRWMWTLPQVAKAFALQRDEWVRWACAGDPGPLLWKAKANEVLALTARDLARVGHTVVYSMGRYLYEVHLMRRAAALQLALDKHGGTCAGINGVFLKRRSARDRRRRRSAAQGSRGAAEAGWKAGYKRGAW